MGVLLIIEDEVIVAAGSVVTPGKVLESDYLYVGNPAKQARPVTERELSFLPMGRGIMCSWRISILRMVWPVICKEKTIADKPHGSRGSLEINDRNPTC